MRYALALLSLITAASLATAAETRFNAGPHEHDGTKYYWLADWKLEVTLPPGVAEDDRFEVLFGTKGSARRTMYYQYAGRSGSVIDARKKSFEWIGVPLGKLVAGKKVLLYGKGVDRVAFLAGVRVVGPSSAGKPGQLEVKATRVTTQPSGRGKSPRWTKLPGFTMNAEARRLWDPAPEKPDWKRAERSSRYAGIALDKVQRWLRERCLPVRDERSGLFRPTGSQ